MYKKSQGLSINVIVIVAIALIVLVVLIAVFTGRMGVFTQGIKGTIDCNKGCEALGMVGVPAEDSGVPADDCPDGRILPGSYTDLTSDKPVCCCT